MVGVVVWVLVMLRERRVGDSEGWQVDLAGPVGGVVVEAAAEREEEGDRWGVEGADVEVREGVGLGGPLGGPLQGRKLRAGVRVSTENWFFVTFTSRFLICTKSMTKWWRQVRVSKAGLLIFCNQSLNSVQSPLTFHGGS